jgi:acetyltransferase-like isoleucine patch superfamily enzyme
MNDEQKQTEPASGAPVRPSLRRRLATSKSPFARLLRWAYYSVNRFAVPAPKILVLPVLWFCLWVRTIYFFSLRVFICEPFFKAVCKQYGRNLHTGTFVHWVGGKGDIVIGDNVTLDGKISLKFAARFSDHPTLQIGDNTGIGHGCSFTIGKLISIGKNCNLSGSIEIMDSNAHRTDPTSRWKLEPPTPEEVRPVIIRDGVWIGQRCIIFPGVKIGEGSVIGAGSIVRSHVPAYSVVAGNPAKVMFRLKNPNQSPQAK